MILSETKKCFVALVIIIMFLPVKAKSQPPEAVTRALAVRVLDHAGNPIHRARVRVIVPGTDFKEQRTTDSNGETKFQEITGEIVKIQVMSEGLPTFGDTYPLNPDVEVIEIRLSESDNEPE